MSGESPEVITSDEQLERLTIPNGFKLDGDHIVIEIVYDGEDVTFRDEDGQLTTMGTLCYLDLVLEVCIRDILDKRESPSDKSASEMAHVLGSIIQHLHQQYHAIMMHQRMAQLRQQGGLGALLAAAMGVEESDVSMPFGAFVLGPNGLERVDMNDPETLERVFSESAEESTEPAEEQDSDEEIIIGEIPPKR